MITEPTTSQNVSRLSEKQIRALMIAKRKGLRLAEKFPEMAQEYREGKTLDELVRKYCSDNKTGFAIAIIHYSLKAILERDELNQLANEHLERGREVGIFALSEEQLRDAGKKGYREGLGKLTKEELGTFGKKGWEKTGPISREAGRRGRFARGYIDYEGEERETEFGLLNEKQHTIHLREEGYSWKEIAGKVNLVFGNARNSRRLTKAYSEWKKMQGVLK